MIFASAPSSLGLLVTGSVAAAMLFFLPMARRIDRGRRRRRSRRCHCPACAAGDVASLPMTYVVTAGRALLGKAQSWHSALTLAALAPDRDLTIWVKDALVGVRFADGTVLSVNREGKP